MKTLTSIKLIAILYFTIPVYSQWIEQTLPGDIVVTLGIDFNNQNNGVTGGWKGDLSQQIYGVAYYTNSGGNPWVEAIVPDSMRVMVEVQVIDDLIAYGAGAYNQTLKRSQLSSNGSLVNNPRLQSRSERIGMNFSRQEDYRGYFVETTDGGSTWHPKGSFVDSIYYLVGIEFIDQQIGFVIASSAGGNSRAILKTTNSGNSWYYVFPFIQYLWIEDMKFVNNLDGIAVGETTGNPGNGVIFKTTDGGENWDPLINPGLSSIFSVSYPNINTIIIGGINTVFQSAVYKSTDGGLNWQLINLYSGSEFLDGVDATQNANFVMVYGTYFTPNQITFIDISSDGGYNWYYSQFPQYENYLPVYSKMVDDTRWYITGSNNVESGFVLFTDNSGGVPVELISFTVEQVASSIHLNWSTATELNNFGFEIERKAVNDWQTIGFVNGKGTTTETQKYSFIDDLFGISDSNLHYRLKQIDYDGSFEYSQIVDVEISVVNEFSLSQNHPNPFNSSSIINYTIPTASNVVIKVYDILANEVATLVNEEKISGSYKVEFDGSGLTSGIYFYQLKAGAYLETKKMILLK